MMKKNYGSEQNILYRLFACGPSMAPAAVAAGAWKKTCEFGFAHYVISIYIFTMLMSLAKNIV